jgi:aromatic ring-opening dioxygenase catalytic subunit (LigB family)
MAKLVLGIGAPHTPFFPGIAKAQGHKSRMAGLFKRLRTELEAARPDLVLMFTADHYVGFFLDNMPTFCIGTFDAASGPHELSRMMPQYELRGHSAFAKGLLEHGIDSGFDLSSTEEMKLDHAAMVPLHFLTPSRNIPFVPIYIKGLVEPLPRAARCYALGQMVRRHIEQWPGAERVAIIASGSFSLEVGGPKMGVIDRPWYEFVVDCIRQGKTEELIGQATSKRMRAAGNTGGELLLWIALLGALGDRAVKFIEPDASPPDSPRDAHAYAVWDLQQ